VDCDHRRGLIPASATNAASGVASKVGGNECGACDESVIPFNPIDPHHYQVDAFSVNFVFQPA
jgi:hypothetical protein